MGQASDSDPAVSTGQKGQSTEITHLENQEKGAKCNISPLWVSATVSLHDLEIRLQVVPQSRDLLQTALDAGTTVAEVLEFF